MTQSDSHPGTGESTWSVGRGLAGDLRRTGLLLVGGGGHAAVLADAADLLGVPLVGVLDDEDEPAVARPRDGGGFGVRRVGTLDDRPDTRPAASGAGSAAWVLAIGDVGTRRRLLASLPDASRRAATMIHPRAIVAASAEIGAGVYVGPGAIVNARAKLGDHALINSGAIVEHDCRVGENTHVAPGAVLGGYATVGADTLVGLGARTLPGMRVGAHAIVAAGAVVNRPVPDWSTVAGIPARALQ